MNLNKLAIILLLFLLSLIIVEAQSTTTYQQSRVSVYRQPSNASNVTVVSDEENETGTFTIVERPLMVAIDSEAERGLHLDCDYEPDGVAIGGIFIPGIALPSPPYSYDDGDCAMLGKEEEIAAYVESLKEIALSCFDATGEKYENVLDDKDKLDEEIDNLPPPDPELENRLHPAMPVRPLEDSLDSHDPDFDRDENRVFTEYLISIREAALGVCEQKDRISEVLFEKCQDINADLRYYDREYKGVPDSAKEGFHSRLSYVPGMAELARNESRRRYNEWFMLVVNNFNETVDYVEIGQRCSGGLVIRNIPRIQDLNYFIHAEIKRENGKSFLVSSSRSKHLSITGNLTVESELELSLSNGTLEVESEGKVLRVRVSPESALDLVVTNGTLEVESVKLVLLKNVLAYEVEEISTVKLVGLIQVRAKVKTTFSSDNLKVISKDKPWWIFLTSKD